MPPHLAAAATLFVLIACAPEANAQWIPTGFPVCGGDCRTYGHVAVPDGAGGMYVAWSDRRDYPVTGDNVFVQRVTRLGTVAPGWPATGLPVAFLDGIQNTPAIAPDGQGGLLVAWIDGRNVQLDYNGDIYMQRIQGDGTISPGWPVNGAPVVAGPGLQYFHFVCSDQNGGAYVVWTEFLPPPPGEFIEPLDVYAQHILPDGSVAPGWPALGLPVCDAPDDQICSGILPDGSGGALFVWEDGRLGDSWIFDTYAQRLQPDGTIAAGWVANGNLLLAGRGKPRIASDEAGGFFVAAATPDDFASDKDYYLQRHSVTGERAPGWPEAGLLVCTAPDSRYGLVMVPDGLGGVLMTWYDYRTNSIEVFATRASPDATLPPGWPPNGVLVSDPMSTVVEVDPRIAPDGLGGAYVAWEREPISVVQHLNAQGGVAGGWPASGIPVAPTQVQRQLQIVSDDAGGAIVAWVESGEFSRLALYAQRFVDEGPVAVQLSLANSAAEPNRVRLTWRGQGAGALVARAERSSAAGGWTGIGTPAPEGPDALSIEDRDVVPGARYGYRLAYLDEGIERRTSETWINVPSALSFALEGFRPNPLTADGQIAFTLPAAGEARLEVLDVSGRRVMSREVGGLGAGRHLLRLDESLAPGVYLARLTHAGRTLHTRGAVMR